MAKVVDADTWEEANTPALTPTASQRHLAVLLSTMLDEPRLSSTVRILDVGCGDAHLLAYLAQTLPQEHPKDRFEFYGFEVGDIGWHGEGYLRRTTDFLNACTPGYRWDKRISIFSATDQWPYEPGSFDFIISNQVLEHVRDHAFLFAEIRRCLATDGVSLHLFPLGTTIYEVHAHMPFVHWLRSPEQRRKLMLLFAHLGFRRKYYEEIHFRGWTNLREFAAIYSDVLASMTNYKSSQEIATLATQAGFQPGFAYTKNFFSTKLLCMMGRPPRRYRSPIWLDRTVFSVLERLASVTLILQHARPLGSKSRHRF
jgi:SAM-dependent methyltransferase